MVIKKKAQMKVQQMAFMLVAVMVFFGLIALMIVGIKMSSLKSKATDISEQNAMLLVTKLANTPELACGDAFGGSRVSCIDFDKAMVLKKYPDKYKKFWRISSLEIIKMYPNEEKECGPENYPECGKITLIQGTGISIENFVALCRKDFDGQRTYDKCELAKILVSYEKIQ